MFRTWIHGSGAFWLDLDLFLQALSIGITTWICLDPDPPKYLYLYPDPLQKCLDPKQTLTLRANVADSEDRRV